MDSNTNNLPQAVERPALRSGDLFGEKRYARVQKMLADERAAYESAWLLSERMLHLCYAIEASPPSEQLTKCSVLAAQLRVELERYEQTRPLTDHEKALIADGWKRFAAASDQCQTCGRPMSEHSENAVWECASASSPNKQISNSDPSSLS